MQNNTWYSSTKISNILDSKQLALRTSTSLQLYKVGFHLTTSCIYDRLHCHYINGGISHQQLNQKIIYQISYNLQNHIATANITHLYHYKKTNGIKTLGVHLLSLKQTLIFEYSKKPHVFKTNIIHQIDLQFIKNSWFSSHTLFSLNWNPNLDLFPTVLLAGVSFASIFYLDIGIKDSNFLQAKTVFISSWLSYSFYNTKVSINSIYTLNIDNRHIKKHSLQLSFHVKHNFKSSKTHINKTKNFSKIHSAYVQARPYQGLSNLKNPSPKINFMLQVKDQPIKKIQWSIIIHDDLNQSSEIIYQVVKNSIPPSSITWSPFLSKTEEQKVILKSYTKYRVIFTIISKQKKNSTYNFFYTGLIKDNTPLDFQTHSIAQLYTDPILFVPNQQLLTKKSEQLLKQIATDLQYVAPMYDYILLNGYVHPINNIKTIRFGYALSKQRAQKVRDYLKQYQIPIERIEIQGFGSKHQIIDKHANKNRKVEIFLVKRR